MKRVLNPWLLVAALWFVAGLNYLDRQVVFSVFPLLQRELHLSDVELGLLGTAFLWVYAGLSPVCGYVADRFGRRKVIAISLLVWSAVTWATGQARSFQQLMAARGCMGFSEAFYLPAALALISDRHGDRTRSLATGIHISGIYAGLVLGGAGGWLGQRYGWRFAFGLLGMVGVAYMLVLVPAMAFTPEELPERRPQLFASLRELWRLPGFVTMLAVFMATSFGSWMLFTWLPLYLYERLHVSVAQAGFYTIYPHVAAICGIVTGGWLADRWSAVSNRGRLMTQALGVIATAPALFLIGSTTSAFVVAIALIVFGFGKGFYDCNTMPVLSQVARGDLRATGYGIFNLGGCFAGGLAAPLAGALKGAVGIGGCLQISSALLVVSAIALTRIRMGTAESEASCPVSRA